MKKKRKHICVAMPCYNEEANVVAITEDIIKLFNNDLPDYSFTIQFIDNCSTDNTRILLRELCAKYSFVRAIFNAKNFPLTSGFHNILNTNGDAVIIMASDFQDPVENIPKYLIEWEKGYKIICGIKKSSHENKIIWFARSMYYKFIKKFSDVNQIEHFTGAGLYDRSFIEILKKLNDPMPSMRGIVAELGYKISFIEFVQPKRRGGKSSQSFMSLFNLAIRNITTYTKVVPRFATFIGAISCAGSFLAALIYLVRKLANWNAVPFGITPIILGVFFFGGVELFILGLLGEYMMNINTRLIHRPLVIEEERINFGDDTKTAKYK